MTKVEAIAWAGGEDQLAARLGIHRNAVQQWGARVPGLRQLQLEMLSRGALVAESYLKPQWEPVLDDLST